MREHQIVISLKPEHFEEVQRMARAAGSKSISAFLRQKLVATLGLGQNAELAETAAIGPDLKQLTGELRRLHRELQIFVADSLANSDYSVSVASVENAIPFPTAVEENFLAEGAPYLAESAALSYRESESNSQFGDIGSPQIPIMPSNPMLPGQVSSALERGSIFGSSSFSIPTSSGYEEAAPVDQSAYSVAKNVTRPDAEPVSPPPSQSQPTPATPTAPPLEPAYNPNLVQPAYELPPSPGQAPYAIPPSQSQSPSDFAASGGAPSTPGQPAYSIPEPPPEPAAPVQRSVQSFAENDELEELADRAFAISPRLGPFNEAVKRFPDPLQDLLGEDLFNDDEPEQNQTNSEVTLPSDDAAAETAVLEEVIDDPQDEHLEPANFDASIQSASSPISADDELQDPNASIEQVVEAEVEDPSADHSEPLETQPDADEDESNPLPDDPPPSPPPQTPPQISGGPPPRKRRT